MASSLPACPPKEIRTSPPIARSAPIWDATGSLPTAVTPPHSGVQPPPPDTTKARLNCFTPVAWAVETRLNGGNKLVSTYGANPAAPAGGAPLAGAPFDAAGAELAGLLGAGPAGELVWEGVAEPPGERVVERLGVGDGAGAVADEGAGRAVGVPAEPAPPTWHAVPLIVQ